MGNPKLRKRLGRFLERARDRLVPERAKPGLRAAGPWLGLLALNALFVLPTVLRQVPKRPYLLLQPSGDLLVLLGICVITAKMRHGAWVRRAAMLIGLGLWIFGWDRFVGRTIVHQTPLFYDQLFLLRHLAILISDLWSWLIFAALVGVVLGAVTGILIGRALTHRVTESLAQRPAKQTISIALALIGAMVATMAVTRDPERKRNHKLVAWSTPALGKNLRKSYEMYRDIQEGMRDSPYADYERDYELARRPDIHIFFVESYGAVMSEHPRTRPRWLRKTRKMQRALEADGWHSVTGYSTAPVSGGRSWLAEASVLTGIVVHFEAVFQHIIADIGETPNLVGFLDAQGYETFLLAPKDRARPGVELENRYDYDRPIYALDLDYRGPEYGWGVIPDQYSLGYAQEYYFRHAEAPVFTNFHMVTSHAPWDVVPKIHDDWELLGDPSAEGPFDEQMEEKEANDEELMLRMARYQRRDPKFLYMGEADTNMLRGFARTIAYDLDVIRRFMLEAKGDRLVIIMGDHQPPLLWEVSENNYDVPVHILARDPALLEEFRALGFQDGMQLPRGEVAAIGHEALFSLLVRTLVTCCSEAGTPPPDVVVDGVRFGK